jgi:hypothetical protein
MVCKVALESFHCRVITCALGNGPFNALAAAVATAPAAAVIAAAAAAVVVVVSVHRAPR